MEPNPTGSVIGVTRPEALLWFDDDLRAAQESGKVGPAPSKDESGPSADAGGAVV
jgi:hypothetical protein